MFTFKQFVRESANDTLNGFPIETLADFVSDPENQKNVNEDALDFIGPGAKSISDKDMHDYLNRIKSREKTASGRYKTDLGKERFTMPLIHASSIEILDADNKKYDLDALRRMITTRPNLPLLKENEKLQHSSGEMLQFYNVGLPALRGLVVNERTGEFIIVDMCPGAGECTQTCYAMKGNYIKFPSAPESLTKRLNWLVNDPKGFQAEIERELAVRYKNLTQQGIKIAMRWHDSGDFFGSEYVKMAYEIARKFPDILFYAYTKIGDLITDPNKPENFIFNFSMGAKSVEKKKVPFGAKNQITILSPMFFDLIKTDRGRPVKKDDKKYIFLPGGVDTLKQRISKKYGDPVDSILTFDELMSTPFDSAPKWNVIVGTGEGDNAATRRDVKTSYLLWH